MATVGVTVPKSGAWVELTAGAAPASAFRLQNVGNYTVLIHFSAATPGTAQRFHGERLEAGQAIETAVLSRVWARIDPGGEDNLVLVATAG